MVAAKAGLGYKQGMGAGNSDYVVLARKYRPRGFSELMGQDALVRTLSNAINTGKIHHAYVLTGIRGVGKTTTARIIAKALNCENGPSITWDENDAQVQAITNGTHMDVFEYDAASNRGVEDVAKLFEGISYAPVSGRYKVYIIDEVHMLSPTAFNSLLKTLEEPPPMVKFIFATTEVNKIPVTVLSRCQRFDLKRIPSETLATLFSDIVAKENVQVAPGALAMIARAADGSARDGLSLLDQAIALSSGAEVRAEVVQSMLGLADRVRLYDLLEAVLGGEVQAALAVLDDLYARGQDALGVVQGLLEVLHLMTRLKVVPGLKDDATLTEIERTRALPLAGKLGLANLSRAYQMVAAAATEVKQAERPYETLGMVVVRVAYLAPLPPLEQLVKNAEQVVQMPVQHAPVAAAVGAAPAPVAAVRVPEPSFARQNQHLSDSPGATEGKPVVAAAVVPPWEAGPAAQEAGSGKPEAGPLPTDWQGIVSAVSKVKPALGATLRQQVRCVKVVAEGEPELAVIVEKGLHDPKDLIRDLRAGLKEATGVVWQIEQVSGEIGDVPPTLVQARAAKVEEQKQAAASDPVLKDVLAMFPGAEIEDIRLADGLN